MPNAAFAFVYQKELQICILHTQRVLENSKYAGAGICDIVITRFGGGRCPQSLVFLAPPASRSVIPHVFFWVHRLTLPAATSNTDGSLEPLFDESMYESGALPPDVIDLQMTPDGDEWWVAGQSGLMVSVSRDK